MTVRARRWLAALAALAVVGVGTPALADPGGAEKRPRGELKVIADGLDNPRGITAQAKGKVFVAEAGRGGDTLVETALGPTEGPVCLGMTGSITRIHRGVARELISTPSVADAVDGSCTDPTVGIGATGPHGITNRGSRVTYSLGLAGDLEDRDLLAAGVAEAADFGTVQHLKRRRAASADLTGFEALANPDMQEVDSNPYGLTKLPRAATLATDAGGNSLMRVAKSGAVELVAVFAPRCVPWELPFPNPIPPAANPCGDQTLFPAQAVPTDVAVAKDGSYLVSTLGGFPFVVGQSRVWRVDPHHVGPAICSDFPGVPGTGCEVFADGLTSLVGIDVDRRGRVYVVQFADAGVLAAESGAPGSEEGSLRVLHPETGVEIGALEGLTLPGGVDTHGKRVYITNVSIIPGAGQVLQAPLFCHRPHKCAAWHS